MTCRLQNGFSTQNGRTHCDACARTLDSLKGRGAVSPDGAFHESPACLPALRQAVDDHNGRVHPAPSAWFSPSAERQNGVHGDPVVHAGTAKRTHIISAEGTQ